MQFIEKWFVTILHFGFLVAIIIGTSIYLFLTIGRHARLRNKAINDISEYPDLPLSLKHAYTNLLNKRYGYIQKYLIFLATTKISGFTGVLFSVLGLVAPLFSASEHIIFLYGLVSIVCIIIALYISPAKRIKEYIVSWRECDAKVFCLDQELSICNGLKETDPHVKEVVDSIVDVINKAEASLSTEEE